MFSKSILNNGDMRQRIDSVIKLGDKKIKLIRIMTSACDHK